MLACFFIINLGAKHTRTLRLTHALRRTGKAVALFSVQCYFTYGQVQYVSVLGQF